MDPIQTDRQPSGPVRCQPHAEWWHWFPDGRRFPRWIWVLAVWLGVLSQVRGASRQFEVFDVFIGYDGVVPEASWFPVVCEIENKGPAFQAVFELTSGLQEQTRRMPIELPTGTRKRFVIPVFSANRYLRGWKARLLDGKGRERAEGLVRPVRRQNLERVPLMAALSRSSGGRPVFPDIKSSRNDLKMDAARLQPELVPDNPIALEGLDVLYLNSEQAMEGRLRAPQISALLAWLHAGGHLVVGVEQLTHVNGTDWLRQLLPCTLTGMTLAETHPELQEWLRSNQRIDGGEYSAGTPTTPTATTRNNRPRSQPAGVPAPFLNLGSDPGFEQAPLQLATGTVHDGRILVGSPARPLVITGRRGRGQVTVLTFSPEREPFLSWQNRPHFWAKVANIPPELLQANPKYQYGSYSIDGVFGAMIDSKQVRKLPVGWLLLLLVGYLAVIGPLDRFWLKKINRQMLTWLTFPAYVAFFSVLIYYIGYKLRAGESEWNEIHVVDVMPVGEQADLRGRTFASIYSPANARYALASDLPFAALRGEFLGNSGGGREASRASVQQRGNNFVAEIFVPVWTSQMYVNDWWHRDDLPLQVSVQPQGSDLAIQVDNRLNRKLTQAKLIVGDQVLDLGDLPARKVRTVTLSAVGQSLTAFLQEHSKMFREAISQRQRAFGGNLNQFTNVSLSAMAACFTSQLSARNQSGDFIAPSGFDLTSLVAHGDAVLLAWDANHTPVKPIHLFSPRRTHRDTLWRVACAVKE